MREVVVGVGESVAGEGFGNGSGVSGHDAAPVVLSMKMGEVGQGGVDAVVGDTERGQQQLQGATTWYRRTTTPPSNEVTSTSVRARSVVS